MTTLYYTRHCKIENLYETQKAEEEDLGLQKGDVGFGHRILKQVNHATIRDPGLRADLMQFIKECTLYDVRDGAVTPQQIVGGTDTWNILFSHTNPARFVTYNMLTPRPVTETCTHVAVILKERVNEAVASGQTFYGKQAFTRAHSNAMATGLFLSAVGTSYDWILNSATSASDAVKQAMFNNLWREAGSELPALLNDPARVTEVTALASAAQAARQADGSNSTLSLLAQETLPHMRNWIEAILYSLFPVVIVLMVISSTEGAKKRISGYLMSLAWIGLWPLLFSVINHLSLVHLRYKARALELAHGVPFQLTDAFDATLTSEQAAIGYMVVLVPFMAGALIRLGQGGFMSVADRMMTGFASAGSSVGAGMASGNISLGQAGLDTASVNTTSMYKYDSNIGLQGGGTILGRADGSIATMSARGDVALRAFQNQNLNQMSQEHRFGSERNQAAHRTDITSAGRQMSYRHSDASTLTEVKGHDATQGTYQQTGEQTTHLRQGSEGGVYSTGQSLRQHVRENSEFNLSAGAHDDIATTIGANAGGGLNIGFGRSGRVAAPNPLEEKRILEAMTQGGASQAQIDQALQNDRSSKTGGARSTPHAGANAGFNANLGLGANLHSHKTYSAHQARHRGSSLDHGMEESAHLSNSYQESSSHTAQGGSGQQSGQTDRHGRDAALSRADDVSRVQDVSDRNEWGTGHRASRSESDAFAVRKDLMADPDLFSKVAARHGLSTARFMNQPEALRMQRVMDYVSEKGMVQQAITLSRQTFSGETLPLTGTDLHRQSEHHRSTISQDLAALHVRKVAQTGYGSTAPISVASGAPDSIASTKENVQNKLNPSNTGSLPARAGALRENVHAWASPDRQVGASRAHPLRIVKEMEVRDIKDTVSQEWKRLTGGIPADEKQRNTLIDKETVSDAQIKTDKKD